MGTLNNKKIKIMIDTESTKNFLNKRMIKIDNLELTDNIPIRTIFGNNESAICNQVLTLNINLSGTERYFNLNFYILENLLVDAILGNEFLFSNVCILDLKNYQMCIENKKSSFFK
ncbi:Protein DDI1 like protein [Dictyocoela muelleri]|nr:Protein DDI1 like protein [Dictyocoela muelleri]